MKKAIIIGASAGMGRELARVLTKNGYVTGITGRRNNLLQELKNENPKLYIPKAFDITETDTVTDYLEQLVEELGGLDLLVISAGTGDLNDDIDYDVEKEIINTNVNGFTPVIDWAFHYFKKRKHGHIVAITSIAGMRGSRTAPAYYASKAYQIRYLESLRQAANRIKTDLIITEIRPGFVATDMLKEEVVFWVASVEKAAREIFSAIKKKKKIAYISRRWLLIGILLKIIPRPIYDRL